MRIARALTNVRTAATFAGVTLAVVCIVGAETIAFGASPNSMAIQGIETLSPPEVERQLPNAHPVNYYSYVVDSGARAKKIKPSSGSMLANSDIASS